MSFAPQPHTRLARSPRPSSGQLLALAIPVMVLAGVASTLLIQNRESLDPLWMDPMGIKMSVSAILWLGVGLVAYLGGCVMLNLFTTEPRRFNLNLILGAVCFALFCLPAVYVLQVAPAAVNIQRNLAEP